ncbi:MAG: hypothetical protein KIS61_36900 [Candidatus Eremiobacteraeota bacterium]|nr:hypothetical protein [Candidatus Eremiobacteraeota bacterium]
MKFNPRIYGNWFVLAGILALLAFRWFRGPIVDTGLSLGISLLAGGLLLRIMAPDSRSKRGQAGTLDAILCSLIGGVLAVGWWNMPPAPDAPYHHNDGGDMFAGLFFVPLAWMLITLPLLLFRMGMVGKEKT